MASEKPARRMTLRQLLTQSEKCSHDLGEQIRSTLLSRITDSRELSRPVRKKSSYPTVLALINSLNKLQQATEESTALVEFLLDYLKEIREHARRERFNRQ